MKKVILTLVVLWLLLSMIGSSNVSAAQREKVTVDLIGAVLGTQPYIMMYGISDIINKHHPWIKAKAHETFGALDNMKRLDADKELRKHAFFVSSVPAMYGARAGKPKEIFPKPIKGTMNLFNGINGLYTWATPDPEIKTPYDFVGKRVDAGAYGSFLGVIGDYVLEAYGVKDKIGQLTHNANQAVTYDSLKDGKFDAAPIGLLRNEEQIVMGSTATQLMASRVLYPVGFSREMIKKAAGLSGIPFSTWNVPAGVFRPGAPAFTTIYYPLHVIAHEDMPEELVYEVMKVIMEHLDELGKHHPTLKWLSKKNMAALEVPVSDFHPGAVKAYREFKTKIGEEYFK